MAKVGKAPQGGNCSHLSVPTFAIAPAGLAEWQGARKRWPGAGLAASGGLQCGRLSLPAGAWSQPLAGGNSRCACQ